MILTKEAFQNIIKELEEGFEIFDMSVSIIESPFSKRISFLFNKEDIKNDESKEKFSPEAF